MRADIFLYFHVITGLILNSFVTVTEVWPEPKKELIFHFFFSAKCVDMIDELYTYRVELYFVLRYIYSDAESNKGCWGDEMSIFGLIHLWHSVLSWTLNRQFCIRLINKKELNRVWDGDKIGKKSFSVHLTTLKVSLTCFKLRQIIKETVTMFYNFGESYISFFISVFEYLVYFIPENPATIRCVERPPINTDPSTRNSVGAAQIAEILGYSI